MSKSGEEMIQGLASLLDKNLAKTAAKKDDKKDKPCKCGKKDCGCGCKGDAEKCKCKGDKKTEKKSSVMVGVLRHLVKLASELDDIGADEASSLVDSALKVIVKNIERKKALATDLAGPEDERLPEMNPEQEEPGMSPEPDYEGAAEEAQWEEDESEGTNWDELIAKIDPDKYDEFMAYLEGKQRG